MKIYINEYFQKAFDPQDILNSLLKENIHKEYIPIGAIPFFSTFINQNKFNFVYITFNEIDCENLYIFLKEYNKNSFILPEIDSIPYSQLPPSKDKLADRINTIYNIINNQSPITLILSIDSLLRYIPDINDLKNSIIKLQTNKTFNRDELIEKLTELGYQRVNKTTEQGFFSVRGDIIDIFSVNLPYPVRINFFDNEIENIRIFNVVSQSSTEIIKEVYITPVNEFLTNKSNRNSPDNEIIYPDKTLIFDLFNNKNTIFCYNSNFENILMDRKLYYDNYIPDNKINPFVNIDKILDNLKRFKNLIIDNSLNDSNNYFKPLDIVIDNFSNLSNYIEEHLFKKDYKIFLFTDYKELAERFINFLSKLDPYFSEDNTFDTNKNLIIGVQGLISGFVYEDDKNKFIIITENDITGKKRAFRKRIRQIETFFDDLEEIKENEYVVHLNYGIGIFRKIERINVLGKEKDYILIEYANKEKLYVPLEQSNLIGKYIGGDKKHPELDSLSNKSWLKKKEKVKKSIEEFARKLISIYAKRKAIPGYAFPPDTEWQKQFEDEFEFIETPDQIKVLNEIKEDMEKNIPMDRLLCGDVGFGKTEIAMRAIFKCVSAGKQAILIAPTTVLVEQHYLTFTKRFKNYPVKISYLTRFTDKKTEREILKKIETHELDIVIGTHKLFSENIKFHSLGLVVLDEEHKFGVEQKELLKSRYPAVDFLSLSATPIPRTLNMSLSTIRDISILQTPPDMRIPVEVIITEMDGRIIKEAIEKELKRNGQVFFLHNSIKNLYNWANYIKNLVPQANITVGHGQMIEDELEKSFIGFMKGEYNVFVSTTIIDSGLDIPNANTIIITDAHKFGLSQLYQLKGRVGRSKKEGYAYFLYPKNVNITEKAEKRLYVIGEYTDLGAGFNIALKDLEIRGAGNILGKEQHGNIAAIGYEMYLKLLKEEIKKLKGEEISDYEVLIDLNYNVYIPDFYINDNSTKMEIYKKILSVKNYEEINEMIKYIEDRFGHLPEEIINIFEITKLKLKAKLAKIESILEKNNTIEIKFSSFSNIDPVKILGIIKNKSHPITINPNQKDTIFYKSFDSNINIKVNRLSAFIDDILSN